jgi:tRNA A-37 threonylcarbamoyl transferase component Bud32
VDDAVIGSVLAGHRLDAIAGQGGMGVVYRATDLALDRQVAVKLIAPALAHDAAFRRRFVSESKVAASLDHPNVIPIHHAGEQEGVLFQVMRYVEGEDLRTLLRREGRLEPELAVPIITEVAAALDAAHARGLVHRDVKPANVLLDADRHVYLTDFGLSTRLGGSGEFSRPGQLLGTVHYISPEQIRGEDVDARTDVYALGAMLFHLLTGGVPFPADNDEARLWAHLSEPPPAPSHAGGGIPAAFDAVIERAMSKDPADRYTTAGELARAAREAVGEPPAPPPEIVDDRRAVLVRALVDPLALAAAAVIVVAGLIFGGLALAVVLAVAVYGAGVTRAYLDDDVREAVRARVEPVRAISSTSVMSEEIQLLMRQAAQTRQRVHDAIEDSDLPYTEVATEVDRLVATMHEAAKRAQRLHEGLKDARPEDVARRLNKVQAENDGSKDELVRALSDQLAVQRRMEAQLGHFYAEMDRMLIELDTVRGNLISVSASTSPDNQQEVAGEVRELRDDMGAVAKDIASASADQGSVTVAKVPR